MSDAQRKTLRSALESARDDRRNSREAEHALASTLAKAVASGKVDEASIRPKIDEVVRSVSSRVQDDAEALNTLHRTLTVEQRKALVALIRERLAKHRAERGGGPRGPDGPPPGLGGPGLGFGLHRLTLSPEQKKAIDAALEKSRPTAEERRERKEKMTSLLDAFATDRFDAKTLFDVKKLSEHVRSRWTRETALAKELVRVLTAEQRAKFAETPTRHRR